MFQIFGCSFRFSVRCYGSSDQHINAQLFPGPFRDSPSCQPLEHHLALVSPIPLPSYPGKPRLINCSFLLSFQSLLPLLMPLLSLHISLWVFWLLVFAFYNFTCITIEWASKSQPRDCHPSLNWFSGSQYQEDQKNQIRILSSVVKDGTGFPLIPHLLHHTHFPLFPWAQPHQVTDHPRVPVCQLAHKCSQAGPYRAFSHILCFSSSLKYLASQVAQWVK